MQNWIGFLNDWNLILVLIGLISLLALSIFVERLIKLQRKELDSRSFIFALRQSLKQGDVMRGLEVCEKHKGSLSEIVKAALLRYHLSKQAIENAMEMTGRLEIADLEKNAKVLSMLAYLAPLIGLLGTVLGFIEAFGEMRQSGLMDISTSRLGSALEYALVTTAAGLTVAIPCTIAYNYLVARIEKVVLEMETCSSEIIDLLEQRREI